MIEADGQAFRRACSRFGLGRYLYNLGPCVVPLDREGQPIVVPELPQWAWPSEERTPELRDQRVVPIRGSGPSYIDVRVTRKIETFRSLIGSAIYREILNKAGHCSSSQGILTRQRQMHVLNMMQTAANLAERIRTLTRRLGTHQLLAEMEDLDLRSVSDIPSFDQLKRLSESLEAVAARRVA